MQEYEKPKIIIVEDPESSPKPSPDDPYTYYSGQPAEERYVPQPKPEKKRSRLPVIAVHVGEQLQSALEEEEPQQSQQTYPGSSPWGRP